MPVLLLVLVRVPVLRDVEDPELAVDVETEVEVDSEVMVDSEAVPLVADPDAEPDAEPPVAEAEPEGAEVSVAEALV